MFECHRRKFKPKKYKMKSDSKAYEKILFISECNICNNLMIELHRKDYDGKEFEAIKLRGKDARNFYEKNKADILHEILPEIEPKNNNPTWVYSDGTKKGDKSYIYDFRGNYKVGEEKPLLLLSQA